MDLMLFSRRLSASALIFRWSIKNRQHGTFQATEIALVFLSVFTVFTDEFVHRPKNTKEYIRIIYCLYAVHNHFFSQR